MAVNDGDEYDYTKWKEKEKRLKRERSAKRPKCQDVEVWRTDECIDKVARKSGYTRPVVKKILNSFFETIGEAMINRIEVHIQGYFSLVYRLRAEHKYADVNTGEVRIRPAFFAPDIEMGSKLKRYYKTFGENGESEIKWKVLTNGEQNAAETNFGINYEEE